MRVGYCGKLSIEESCRLMKVIHSIDSVDVLMIVNEIKEVIAFDVSLEAMFGYFMGIYFKCFFFNNEIKNSMIK